MANTTNITTDMRNEDDGFDFSYVLPYCILFPVICAVGMIGNVLTPVIVHEKKKVTSVYLIMFLAISDMLVLTTRMVFVIYRLFQLYYTIPMVSFSKYIPGMRSC